MGLMDNMQDKMGDMSDEAKDRLNELKSKEDTGQLDDKGKQELQNLRERLGRS